MEEENQYLTNSFLTNLYDSIQPKEDLLNCSDDKIETVREERKKQVRDILKLSQLASLFDEDITYSVDSNIESMGLSIVKYKVNAVKGLPFPVYHVKPEKPNGNVIFYLHGHDDLGIMGALLERYDKERYHKMIPLLMAKEGYDVIAPELIGFGDARFYDFPTGTEKLNGCVVNNDYLTLAGFSIAGFRAYQALRTLDFCEEIGMCHDMISFGVSGGGMTCQQVSAIDNRISKVILACYANTYKNSALAKEHCVDNYVPGMLTVGDSYKMLSLVAPKPLLTVNGIWDRAFPEAGSKIAFAYLEKVYQRLCAEDKYHGFLFEGKHEINTKIVLDWLEQNCTSKGE